MRERSRRGGNFGPTAFEKPTFSPSRSSSSSPLRTREGHSYYDVEGNLRFMSGNNYFHVTSARDKRPGGESVDGAQVRRGAFAGVMTNGRRRVRFLVCVLERKLTRFFLMANNGPHDCDK